MRRPRRTVSPAKQVFEPLVTNPARYVIGVNSGPHDASAAVVRDGEILAMLEQERVSRRRHAFGESPADAIRACLDHADVCLDDIAEIAVGWNVPLLAEIEGVDFTEDAFVHWLLGPAGSTTVPRITYFDHHLAHAASAFLTSGFADSAIIVVDGRGEAVATTLAVGGPSGIETIRSWGTELSLGHYYGWASEWAGLGLWGTGKLMGLAAYGQPVQPMPLSAASGAYSMSATPPRESPVRMHFALHRRALRAWFRAHNFPFAQGGPDDVMAHADFAASVQQSLEQTLLELARWLRSETGLSRLTLAGGVAMNCSANGAILRSRIFDDVWVPPFANDSGVSVGAALLASTPPSTTGRVRLPDARLAPVTPPQDPDLLLTDADIEVFDLPPEDSMTMVAADLADGCLVGWFQGRAEVGARALGARSILCDARDRVGPSRANRAKGREQWRPLAPAVLVEHFEEYFGCSPPGIAEFMLAALPVMEALRHRIPGAVHVDGTARPQAVTPEQGRYYRLLQAFFELTGTPAVINTSFNGAGEPIVLTPRDAVATFRATGLDCLVIDDIYLRATNRKTHARRWTSNMSGLSFTPWRDSAPIDRSEDARL